MAAATAQPDVFSEAFKAPPIWQSRRLAYAVFFLALGLRLFMLGWPPTYVGIEDMHVRSSPAYVETGHFDPENDHATPLRKFLLYSSLKSLGDTPVARRLPNAVFGALTAFCLVLLGQQLFPGRRIGALAGLFLATDPFHISFSRSTWEDIPVALFLVAGLYFLSKALSESDPQRYLSTLIWSGLSFSLALAARRYSAALLLLIFAWLVYREFNGPAELRGPSPKRRLAFLAAVFIVLPLLVYTITFYPWFARGNSFPEWLSFQQRMVHDELTDTTMENVNAAKYYGKSAGALDWFIKPIVFGSQMPVDDNSISTLVIISNPLSWLLVWPALIVLLFYWRRSGRLSLAVLILGFLVLYAPFLAARRVILVYSVLSVLPLAFLMVATLFEAVQAHPSRRFRRLGAVAIAAVMVVNVAFYPLAIAMPLPRTANPLIPFKSSLNKLGSE